MFIKSRKDGRKKFLELTDKGEKYADVFLELLELFEEEKNDFTDILEDKDSLGQKKFSNSGKGKN
ncbi:MAG: hypothetical protein ABEJ56_03030 [Candidatus Nanohaloarchaea archaeon]